MAEYNWDNSVRDSFLGNENKVSVGEIIELYLQRCKEVKEKLDRDIRYFYPFEFRVCQIINDVLKEYFDGKVDVENIEPKDTFRNGLKYFYEWTAIDENPSFNYYGDFLEVNLEDLWKKESNLSFDDEKQYCFPSIFIDNNLNIISSVPKEKKYSTVIEKTRRRYYSICGDEVIDKCIEELRKNKKELMILKKKSDNYKNSRDQVQILKKQYLEYLNGFIIKLDNGVRLNLSIREKDFYESKFDKFFITLKDIDIFGKENEIDKHGLNNIQCEKRLIVSPKGTVYNFDFYGKNKEGINEDKKISKYMSDAKCVEDLLKPFNQINISEEIKKRSEKLESELIDCKKEQLEKKIINTSTKYSFLARKCDFIDSEMGKFYNKVDISEEELFEKDTDGVLRIKSFLIDYLKYFNLYFINFKDVDVRGIDFTDCNAYSLKPKDVYKGLEKCVIPIDMVGATNESWDVSNVILYGTEFKYSNKNNESDIRFYPSSFVDAKIDKYTKFPRDMENYIDSIKKQDKDVLSKKEDLDDTLELYFPSMDDLPIRTSNRPLTNREQELLDSVIQKEEQVEEASKELIQKTQSVLNNCLESLDEYEKLGESTNKYYNKLYINEKILYDNKDGVLVVKEKLRKYLKYFDLYKLTFEGVDISNLDFSNCNLGFFMIDKVVNAENCKIPGELIGPGWDFKDVNIKGADLSFSNESEKLKNQFIFNNLDSAISDYNTMLPDTKIQKEEKPEIKLTLEPEENESSNGMKR